MRPLEVVGYSTNFEEGEELESIRGNSVFV